MGPIDFVRLREFSDGTPEGLRDLCTMFLDHLREVTGVLRGAAADGRAEVLRVEAHKAAGTAGACGARGLCALLTALESAAVAGQLDQAAALMRTIDEEVARVTVALEAGGEPAESERS